MKIINKQYCLQVKDILNQLKNMDKEAIVSAIYIDKSDNYYSRTIYKITETADETEVYLNLGDNKF